MVDKTINNYNLRYGRLSECVIRDVSGNPRTLGRRGAAGWNVWASSHFTIRYRHDMSQGQFLYKYRDDILIIVGK